MRVKKMTNELAIGDVFFFYPGDRHETPCEVIAQGPHRFAYQQGASAILRSHYEVFVDAPRKTVGEFQAGESFTADGKGYLVLARGEQFSFVDLLGPVRGETLMSHGYPCTEYGMEGAP